MNGQRGVQIFFAISGFLITSTSLRRWGNLSRISPRDFYILRFARIAPLLLLLLAVLSGLHFAHFKDFVVRADRGLALALFAAVTFQLNLLQARHGYLPGSWDVLWSISVEEMFYLFFPLLCRFFSRGRLLTATLFLFVVLGPFGRTVFSQGLWKEYSWLGGMDAIALGCLTAMLVSRLRFSRPSLRILLCAGAAILILMPGLSRHVPKWMDRSGLVVTILALGTCAIIGVAAQAGWRSPRALSPLLTLGRHSYEVYLTHMFVVFVLFNLFVASGKPMLAVPLLFIAVVSIAGLFGNIVARFYSEPMNRRIRSCFGDGPAGLGRALDKEPAFTSGERVPA